MIVQVMNMRQKHKVLPVELLQLNSRYDTDQGRFLVVRKDFTVLYRNPKRGDRQITLKKILETTINDPYRKRVVSKTIFVVKFTIFLIYIDQLYHLISWKSSICPGLESQKQFNKIFFCPKFASKVAPKVSPKPPTKAFSCITCLKVTDPCLFRSMSG